MDISLESDCLLISFSAPAKTIGVERYHRNNGLEMILHLLRGILKDYQYDKNTYDRVMKTIDREFSPTATGTGGSGSGTGGTKSRDVIRLSHSSQSLESLCRAAIRGRVAHSDARFIPLSSLTTVSSTPTSISTSAGTTNTNTNRYGVHAVDKSSNPLGDIKKLMQSQLSKLQHQEYALALPGLIASRTASTSTCTTTSTGSGSVTLTDTPTRDKVCAGVELTIAGNMTLGRMRELTVRVLGTVLSDKQMHYVENTVRPSRKMKRKLQQQKLKDEFNRRTNATATATATGSGGGTNTSTNTHIGAADTVPTTPTATATPKASKANTRRKSGAAQKNRAMKATTDSGAGLGLGLGGAVAMKDRQRFAGVMGVAWNDASNIRIESVADGCRLDSDGPCSNTNINTNTNTGSGTIGIGTTIPSVKHAVGYLVGPAYNKHGVLCDDPNPNPSTKPTGSSSSSTSTHGNIKDNDKVKVSGGIRISPPVEKIPYLPPISPITARTRPTNRPTVPTGLSNSRIHTGTSVESIENREKLNIYLRRLQTVRKQEIYDNNALNYYKSHPLYVEMMTMLIEQVCICRVL